MRFALAPALALLALALALAPTVSAQEPEKKGETAFDDKKLLFKCEGLPIEVKALLTMWGPVIGSEIAFDEEVVGKKINLAAGEQTLTWGTFKKVLEANDIVVEAREVDGKWVTYVHLRRNLHNRVSPATRVLGDGEKAARSEEFITAVVTVKNGAGNDIFATLRGLLVRDSNRVGNILYVRGPEAIILVDFASNVDYYVRVLRKLDTPVARPVLRLYPLKNAPAQHLATIVKNLLAVSEPEKTKGAVVVASPTTSPLHERSVHFDDRTNQLIVTAFEHEHEELKRVIEGLDVAKK